MRDEDAGRFAVALGTLAEVFGESLSQLRAEAYFGALRELTLEEATAAVRHAIRTCRFFPRPVELLEAVRGTADDRVEAAWTRWIEATAVGAYESVAFQDDPALAETLRVMFGSWAMVCRLEAKDESYRHAEFRRLYAMMRKRAPESMSPRLPGLAELDRGERSLPAGAPPAALPASPDG